MIACASSYQSPPSHLWIIGTLQLSVQYSSSGRSAREMQILQMPGIVDLPIAIILCPHRSQLSSLLFFASSASIFFLSRMSFKMSLKGTVGTIFFIQEDSCLCLIYLIIMQFHNIGNQFIFGQMIPISISQNLIFHILE